MRKVRTVVKKFCCTSVASVGGIYIIKLRELKLRKTTNRLKMLGLGFNAFRCVYARVPVPLNSFYIW